MRLLLCALPVLAACSSAPPAGPPAEEGVKASIFGMYSAFKDRNLEAVTPFLSEGSTCYDAKTSRMLVGRKAVLDHFGAILQTHTVGSKWESKMQDLKVDASGDLAVATYTISTTEGGNHALAAVTHVFRRQGDRWVAVHLHRSWNVAK